MAPQSPPARTLEKAKTCEELGGRGTLLGCDLNAPGPFEASFTGTYKTDRWHKEPTAVFKVTNKSDHALNIRTANVYAYDRAGKQLDISVYGRKLKYSTESSLALIQLEPGETEELITAVIENQAPPETDTLQVEFMSWGWPDRMHDFNRHIEDPENRPRDGWK